MSLYPTTLFNFTSRSKLEGILNSTFSVSYARERIIGGKIIKEFAVPMVSFSDLRLSELKDNIGTYGKFGIGLKKSWAIENGLNPVMYASDKSNFTENFLSGLEEFYQIITEINDYSGRSEMAYNNTMNTLRYIKNYQGDLIRPFKKTVKDYVFANEREWRFVPAYSENVPTFVSIDRIRTSQQKSALNKKIRHMHLGFTPEDIKYLIVEKDADIYPMIGHLKKAKINFPQKMVDRLSSRILTYEQIENDI